MAREGSAEGLWFKNEPELFRLPRRATRLKDCGSETSPNSSASPKYGTNEELCTAHPRHRGRKIGGSGGAGFVRSRLRRSAPRLAAGRHSRMMRGARMRPPSANFRCRERGRARRGRAPGAAPDLGPQASVALSVQAAAPPKASGRRADRSRRTSIVLPGFRGCRRATRRGGPAREPGCRGRHFHAYSGTVRGGGLGSCCRLWTHATLADSLAAMPVRPARIGSRCRCRDFAQGARARLHVQAGCTFGRLGAATSRARRTSPGRDDVDCGGSAGARAAGRERAARRFLRPEPLHQHVPPRRGRHASRRSSPGRPLALARSLRPNDQ